MYPAPLGIEWGIGRLIYYNILEEDKKQWKILVFFPVGLYVPHVLYSFLVVTELHVISRSLATSVIRSCDV